MAFGGSRTFHRIACAIEDAGFEIRDTIMWLYGSGFPKSMNIGLAIDKRNGVESPVIGTGKSGGAETHTRCMNSITQGGKDVFGGEFEIKEAQNEWKGWGTALKPSFEPIIVARKPVKDTLVDNVLEYGVGGLNIEDCRVGTETIKGGTMPDFRDIGQKSKEAIGIDKLSFGQVENAARKPLEDHVGRYPANTILTYDDTDFDEVCGGFPYTKSTGGKGTASKTSTFANVYNGGWEHNVEASHLGGLGDSGSACRYYYCAKATRKDRDEGLTSFEIIPTGELQGGRTEGSAGSVMREANGRLKINPFAGQGAPKKNMHPTVKPTELMQYLIRLVTPKGGTVLDPFMGSGSTGKACAYENIERNANYKFIGIEKDEDYCKIAFARIEYASEKENEIEPQTSLF